MNNLADEMQLRREVDNDQNCHQFQQVIYKDTVLFLLIDRVSLN